jgi:hypothetical protein
MSTKTTTKGSDMTTTITHACGTCGQQMPWYPTQDCVAWNQGFCNACFGEAARRIRMWNEGRCK